jgi:galactosyl transferase GMA12/MNN10 family
MHLALVPQRIMNSYNRVNSKDTAGIYEQGDFLVHFSGCNDHTRSCAKEMLPYMKTLGLAPDPDARSEIVTGEQAAA